ncbi:hypothetical protein BMS3Abin15_00431 [bacterium BMS3Abin15]|nr:hypothetical protein BMS3Abin15_00431 [bacterium BMS3Abin15]HDZ85045.1 hypothetical protein [Candidatus Moranbacteria bacterium]
MFINLDKKIEEIRRKPEYIRHRYVIGAVAVSMLLILIIWIFSIKESFKSMLPEKENFSGLKESFDENINKEDMPSLEDLLEESGKVMKEGIAQDENIK